MSTKIEQAHSGEGLAAIYKFALKISNFVHRKTIKRKLK